MKEPPQQPRPGPKPSGAAGGVNEAEGVMPASIPEGPRDARPGNHTRPAGDAGDVRTVPVRPTTSPETRSPGHDEAPALPEGAWLAMRKSGGLLFSSREVVVYEDGRVVGSAIGGGRSRRDARPRRLAEPQLAALRRAVEQCDFARTPAAAGRQGGDAFVYEIAVRDGRATHAVEVFEGSIPETLVPLIEQLNRLLPRDEP